jgi:hypothetical protein
VNPLIGAPDLYPVSYPWGVQLAGAVGPMDYRAAIVDGPASNERYVPAGGSRARGVVGAGVTPVVGARLGASFTSGPYLGPAVDSMVPPGSRWEDFGQWVLALDGSLSRGYLELKAEAALSSYDVPGHADPVSGTAAYLEAKYTWTPRFFTAARLEHNAYAFIRPMPGRPWLGLTTTFADVELGFGYRLGVRTLVKASVRVDAWDVSPALRPMLPDGHALALQLSHGFDLTAWLRRVEH